MEVRFMFIHTFKTLLCTPEVLDYISVTLCFQTITHVAWRQQQLVVPNQNPDLCFFDQNQWQTGMPCNMSSAYNNKPACARAWQKVLSSLGNWEGRGN